MEPQQQNPYDFILAEPPAVQKSKFNTNGKIQRLIVVIAGLFILIIIAIVLMSVIGGAGKKDQTLLLKVAAAQQDLIKLTSLGASNTRDSDLVSQATTASIILTGQSKDTTAEIAALKIKNSGKLIASYSNSSYKLKLDEARKNGNYNETYKLLYSDRFGIYSSLLSQTYSATGSKKLKELLHKFTLQLNSIDPSATTNN